MDNGMNLKKLLEKNEFIIAPGAYNALTGKIIEDQGFNAVYMTGYGTSAANFGLPDIGLLSMTEMVQNAKQIVDAVNIPVIADADTGYGNAINISRTIKEYEQVGVQAIHIEDQTWPKRCGHMMGKDVIPKNQMVEKIRAAVDSRDKSEFLIIARTDAIATHGFKEAIQRGNTYSKAGADIIFIEAPRTLNQIRKIPQMIDNDRLLLNMSPKTPRVSFEDLEKFGYSIAIYPGICLAASILACMEDLELLKNSGKQRDFSDIIKSFSQLNQFLGLKKYLDLEKKYSLYDD
ncbi:MAG: carboxyvinyl-carboxyphosphonate phosphorylmutase|nr:carboxyvinyl-carboxyphosphonate phosphorylmutase [Candidatus Lokiarchaeota archaeon]MBD3202066.1 carboxyvinyl-carboxyphosphonate phosphorylmutase [Candidatus Lokiarchaeota archaeon]